MMGYWPSYGGAWPAMFMMGLFMLVFLAAGFLLLRWLLTSLRGPSSQGALRILEERFARGEINEEEYLSRRRLLQTSSRAR